MRKFALLILLLVFMCSCRNNGKTPGQKLDTLIKQVDTTANQLLDSTKSKSNELKNEIKNRFDKKDTIRIKDTSERKKL
jgi:ElaB/YqjD/DUF883 family membrane-anchored ribosome-binding protein